MKQQPTTDLIAFPSQATKDVLTPILREGARQMLVAAIEAEVQEWVEQRAAHRDESGHQLVVRNGFHPPRTIQSGIGDIEIRKPRAHDRRCDDQHEVFISKILPPYL